jgi:outer membrane protein assembly factor BamB
MRYRGLVVALALTTACRRPAPVVAAPKASPSAAPKPAEPAMKVVDERLELLAQIPAYFAASAHGRVFALTPDRRAAFALDLATGARLWDRELASEGPTQIVPSFGPSRRLFLHGNGRVFVLDAATGALVKESEGPYSKRFIEEKNGACFADDPCGVQFLDCEDGQPYGPRLSIAVMHVYKKLGGPHDNVCWGPLMVLGRAKNLIVAVTDGRTWDQQEAPITVAFDVKTGKTAWSSRAHGCRFCASEASGMASDGSACWIGDVDGKLDVFDCATGQSMFVTKIDMGSARPEVFTAWAGGLFVSGKRAALLDPKSGTARWSIDLPPDGLALPLATALDLPRFSTWGAHTVLLVDPKAGKEAARFSQPEYTEILQSEDLGLRSVKGPSFDATGKQRPPVEDAFSLDRDHFPRTLLVRGKKAIATATDLALIGQTLDHVAFYVWGSGGTSGSLVIAKLRQ